MAVTIVTRLQDAKEAVRELEKEKHKVEARLLSEGKCLLIVTDPEEANHKPEDVKEY